MSSNWQDILNALVPTLGQAAVDALSEKLKDVAAGLSEDWQRTILTLIASSVEKHGLAGVQLALETINDLLDGKDVEIDWTDLKTASDLVGHMQNAEADHKTAVNDFLARTSEALGFILSALLKGLVA